MLWISLNWINKKERNWFEKTVVSVVLSELANKIKSLSKSDVIK
jgi:hypothetical protein